MSELLIPEKGFVKGLSYAEYAQPDRISSHGLMEILRSPAHYKASLAAPRKMTPAMEFGLLAHTAILEPARFRDKHVVEPSFTGKTKDGRDSSRSAEAKAKREEWHAMVSLDPETIIVSEPDANRLVGMINALQSHSRASQLFHEGISEISGFWTDPGTGVKCRARPDYLREDGLIIEYKTTTDASPKAFERTAYAMNYHVQAGLYVEAVQQISNGKPVQAFVFVVQEVDPPFAVMVYSASDVFLDLGKEKAKAALATFAQCQKTDQWPAYPEDIQNLFIPSWAMYEEEAQQ